MATPITKEGVNPLARKSIKVVRINHPVDFCKVVNIVDHELEVRGLMLILESVKNKL